MLLTALAKYAALDGAPTVGMTKNGFMLHRQ